MVDKISRRVSAIRHSLVDWNKFHDPVSLELGGVAYIYRNCDGLFAPNWLQRKYLVQVFLWGNRLVYHRLVMHCFEKMGNWRKIASNIAVLPGDPAESAFECSGYMNVAYLYFSSNGLQTSIGCQLKSSCGVKSRPVINYRELRDRPCRSVRDRRDKTGSILPCIASSDTIECRNLIIFVVRKSFYLNSKHSPMYREDNPTMPASYISLAKDASRNALSFNVQKWIRSSSESREIHTLPSENFSNRFSHMKYTLETQLGRISITPIATNSPSSRYSWW